MGWRGKDLEDVCGGEISKEKNLDKYEKKVKQVGGKKKKKNKCVGDRVVALLHSLNQYFN